MWMATMPGQWQDWGAFTLNATPDGIAHIVWWTRNGTVFAHCPDLIEHGQSVLAGETSIAQLSPEGAPTASGEMCSTCRSVLFSRCQPVPDREDCQEVAEEGMYDFIVSGTAIGTWDCATDPSHSQVG